jgi:hypothetical protein
MSEPLEWDDDNNAYRDKVHYYAYETSDGGAKLVISSMFTDEPNTVEENIGEDVLPTLADAKQLAEALADQRGWSW